MIGAIQHFLERNIRKRFSSALGSRVKPVVPIGPVDARVGSQGEKGLTMRRHDKSWMELDELLEPFLPDEHAETGTAVAVEFRNRLVKLEQQVLSQYTSMAAYAVIAKQDAEAVKVEARADLDRSQATVIGLTEKLRNEVKVRLDGLERRSDVGDMSPDDSSRLAKVERDLASALAALQQCIQENHELRDQMAVLVEHRMQEEGWLVSTGTADALSMR
jgi:hypothetical protein